MATIVENLQTIRANYIQQLLDISASPKPSYSIDGQSVSWTEYQTFLTGQLKSINEQLQAMQPYCVVSRGRS